MPRGISSVLCAAVAGVIGSQFLSPAKKALALTDEYFNPPTGMTWDATSLEWRAENNSAPELPLQAWMNDGSVVAVFTNKSVSSPAVSIPVGPVTVNSALNCSSLVTSSPGFSFTGTGSITVFLDSTIGAPTIQTDDATIALTLKGTSGMEFDEVSDNLQTTLATPAQYTGPTTIGRGILTLAIKNAIPTASDISFESLPTSAKLDATTFDQTFGNITITSVGTLATEGGNLTIASLDNEGTVTASAGTTGLGGAITISALSGAGNITLTGTLLTVGRDAAEDTYTGSLSGNGSLFKVGSGELILTGTGILTHALSAPAYTVTEGTLAGTTSNLGNTVFVATGATLLLAQQTDGTFNGTVSGAGNWEINAFNTSSPIVITLAQPSTFTGTLTLDVNATAAVSNDNQLGTFPSKTQPLLATLDFAGGTLRTTSGITTARSFFVEGFGGTIDTDGGNSTFSGNFSNLTVIIGGIPLAATGTLTLTGGGNVTFSAATDSVFAVTVNNSTTMNVQGSASFQTTILTLGAAHSTSATFNIGGLNSSGTVEATNLTEAGPSSALHVSSAGSQLIVDQNLSVGTSPIVLGGKLTIPGESDSVSVLLAGAITVTGTTTLKDSSTLSVSTGSFTTGALASGSADTPTITLSGSSALTIGSNSAINGNFTGQIVNGVFSPGGIHKIGSNTQTLSGANTYTGPTLIDGGSLIISSTGSLSATTPVTNNANLTFQNFSQNLASLQGTGTTTLSGTTLAISGSHTSGPISDNGTHAAVAIFGNQVTGAINVGTLSVIGSLQFQPNTALTSKVGSLLLVGNGFVDLAGNKLIVEDTTTHAAILTQIKTYVQSSLQGLPGITSTNLPAGQTVAVVDNAVRLASFGGANNFGGTNNVDAGSILVDVTYTGDANLDGVVDIQDLTDVANHWQQSATDWSQGDFDGNGVVDIQDLTAVANHWQDGIAGGAGSSESFGDALNLFGTLGTPTSAPEPGSLLLLALGGLATLRRRR